MCDVFVWEKLISYCGLCSLRIIQFISLWHWILFFLVTQLTGHISKSRVPYSTTKDTCVTDKKKLPSF